MHAGDVGRYFRVGEPARAAASSQHLCLDQALLVFVAVDRVPYDPAADAELGDAALTIDNRGSDRHIEVSAAVWGEVSNRPGIYPSRRSFELVDDAHRTVLRRTSHGARGEHRCEQF